MIPIDTQANTIERMRRNWQSFRWGIGALSVQSGANPPAITGASPAGSFFASTATVPAGFFLSTGRGVRIRANGAYTAPDSTKNISLALHVGGNGPGSAPIAYSGSGLCWMFDAVARTRPYRGNVIDLAIDGYLMVQGNISDAPRILMFSPDSTSYTLDGSVNQVIKILCAFSAGAGATYSATMTNFVTELLY